MGRIIAVYGVIGGVIVALGMLIGIMFSSDHGATGMIVGYLSMLVAMSMVFVGVRQYRDTVKGGLIGFWPALGVGLGIAGIASLFYVLAWEFYMYQTNYSFMAQYVSASLQTMKAEGASAAEIAKFSAEMKAFEAQYANPLFRMGITLSEIAPVAILVSLVSAALLRIKGFMPARSNT
jgi:hypothetical protein